MTPGSQLLVWLFGPVVGAALIIVWHFGDARRHGLFGWAEPQDEPRATDFSIE